MKTDRKEVKTGFTLIELLIVIAIIAILASILLPVLAAAQKRAKQAYCLNNMRQLGMGFVMYVGDNNQVMPTDGSKGAGWHPEDWIYWQGGGVLGHVVVGSQQSSPPMQYGQIAQLIGYSNTNQVNSLFRCPLDLDNSGRIAVANSAGLPTYNYSYSVNSGSEKLNQDPNNPSGIVGIASTFGNGIWQPFKMTQARHPATLDMLGEEPTSRAPSELPAPYIANTSVVTLDDGRWEPGTNGPNVLTVRHNGNADLAFADGHVEAVNYQIALQAQHTVPSQ